MAAVPPILANSGNIDPKHVPAVPVTKSSRRARLTERATNDASDSGGAAGTAERFFGSDSSIGVAPLAGGGPTDARSRAAHTLRVFGASMLRMKRDKERRHSLSSGRGRGRAGSLLADDTITHEASLQHADSEQPRRRPIAWDFHSVANAVAGRAGSADATGQKASEAPQPGLQV